MPPRIPTARKREYARLRKDGWNRSEAAREVGVSLSWAKAYDQGLPSASTKSYALIRGDAELPDVRLPDQLGDEARRALDDFEYFRRRYMGRVGSPWQTEAANQIRALLETGDKEYAVINCPPGSGKSTLFTHDVPVWLVCRNRALRCLVGSRTESQAKKYTGRIRRTLERKLPVKEGQSAAFDAQATLVDDFGRFKPLVSDVWRIEEFVVAQPGDETVEEKEPTFAAYGIDSGFLGGRYDLIVWDDLVDKRTNRTAEAREQVRAWWDEEAETRLEPGGLLILQGQRMGPEDLYRYVLNLEAVDDDEQSRPQYHHIVFPAHRDDQCDGKHGRNDPAWPDGCLLDPRRLPWRELSAKKRNNSQRYQVLYQQEDVDPASVLVPKIWVDGGKGVDGVDYPGCWDPHRDICELPKGLTPPLLSIATADPSPTKYWAVQWWIVHPATEQRFLMDALKQTMDAPDFLDLQPGTSPPLFSGVMHEWQQRSRDLGVPITHWIVEANAAQRFLLQYQHVKVWQRIHRVQIIPHQTHRNKTDPQFGVQSIAPHFRDGRVRLPGKQKTQARPTSFRLIDEATRWPEGQHDDQVMAYWFLEWNLPPNLDAEQAAVASTHTVMDGRMNPDQILNLYRTRKTAQGGLVEMRRQVRDTYNGDVVIPLPELNKNELPAVANLLALGVDQTGARIGSVMPDVWYPAVKAGKTFEDRARDRRRRTLGWWADNRMNLKIRRRARHLIGYGTTPVVVRPDFKRREPKWELRDPLGCYPPPELDDDPHPADCIFAYTRTLAWLAGRYPDRIGRLRVPSVAKHPDHRVEMVEYVDAEQTVLIAVGAAGDAHAAPDGLLEVVELDRAVNPAGVCPAVVPGRVTLDRLAGQFDQMVGMYQIQARLNALEVIAAERAVFPEKWIVSRDGQSPQVITVANPREGVIGEIQNGGIDVLRLDPSFMNLTTQDRIERAQRLVGAVPAEYGGESTSNVRTGRRGDQILGAAIDMPIQEAQEILQASLEAENRVAIAVDKAWFDRPKQVFIAARGTKGQLDYQPSRLWETDAHTVTYTYAGVDSAGLVITGGQRVGMGTLSHRSFMELDPLVEDPEFEWDRITGERLRLAGLTAIEQAVVGGQIGPAEWARIAQLVEHDKLELPDAVLRVQQEVQERQAAQVEPGSPESQPGLGPPELAPVAEPQPGVTHLAQLMGQLRRPQMTMPSEKAG